MRFVLVLLVASLLCACGGGNGSSSSTGSDTVVPVATAVLSGVAYGDGVFVTVGATVDNTPMVETSTDGITWKRQTFTDKGATVLTSVAYGSSGFVAMDDSLDLFRSRDGVSWTSVAPQPVLNLTTPPNYRVSDVGWDGSQYVVSVFNLGAAGAVLTSPDGMSWTSTTVPNPASGPPQPTGDLQKLAGTWFGLDDLGDIASSTDLADWTEASISFYSPSTDHTFTGLIQAGGQLLAIGQEGMIAASMDGTTWNEVSSTSVPTEDLRGVAWNGSAYVVTGLNTTVLYSNNGLRWRSLDLSGLVPGAGGGDQFGTYFYSVAAAPHGAFVLVGTTEMPPYQPVEITSADGVHWSLGHP